MSVEKWWNEICGRGKTGETLRKTYTDPVSFFFFFFAYFPSPNLGLTPPGTYKPNARGSDACRGSNGLWTRTVDRYTRAGLLECVWSAQCQGLLECVWSAQCQGLRRRQHRTEHKEDTPNPRTEIKIPDPAGNRTRVAGWEGRDSTDHATATDDPVSSTTKITWSDRGGNSGP